MDSLGDPTFFMTNSHADTYCPYLAKYIKVHAQIADGAVDDPECSHLSKNGLYGVKLRNIIKYPHLVAEFFHLKTELMVEYVGSCMGCMAHWCRYEWQMRGSTHVHYFFWCKGAPRLQFLDDWVKVVMSKLGYDDQPLNEEKMQILVDSLNEHSAQQSNVCALAQESIQYYTGLCSRWNGSWDDQNHCPVKHHQTHSSATCHVPIHEPEYGDLNGLPAEVQADRAAVQNDGCRHVPHNVNYCMRMGPDGQTYCRFHYPQQVKSPNVPHFRAKEAGGGIQWELYLPINDPWMLINNPEQSASQRANTDCKPLVGHYSAIQYVCKYATKMESASKTFNASMARAFSGYEKPAEGHEGVIACPPGTASPPHSVQPSATICKPASAVYASFLMQQNGARNWSSQEVAHVLMGIHSTISSHKFRSFSTSNWNKVKHRADSHVDEFGDALEPNKWEKYLDRMHTMWSMLSDLDTSLRTLDGQLPLDHQQ